MLTDEQRYLYDLRGYLVLEQVLDAQQLEQMHREMDEHGVKDPDNNPNRSRFGGFLGWGENWRGLIDHPRLVPVLEELLGEGFRLDHAYGMAARASVAPTGENLHHHAGMFAHGCYYTTHGPQMHNGLIVVSYALVDMDESTGGFCCIPGSHKATYPTPEQYTRIQDNPLLASPPLKAGDALIFCEALTHGTRAWIDREHERRTVLIKYCPGYMQWAKKPMSAEVDGLTDRQRQILSGPSVARRAFG